jgi:hypothetical protein
MIERRDFIKQFLAAVALRATPLRVIAARVVAKLDDARLALRDDNRFRYLSDGD